MHLENRLAVDGNSASALAEVRILGGVHGVDHAQLVGVDEVVHHLHFDKVPDKKKNSKQNN